MGCCWGKNKVGDIQPDVVEIRNQTQDKKDLFVKDKKDQVDRDRVQATTTSHDRQIDEWLRLIDRLNSNHSLVTYARFRKRDRFNTVREVGEYLGRCREATTDVEKAWLVYVWITDNIVYDVEGYRTKNYAKMDSQTVLERGLGVCAGYANLFKDLCDVLGVECVKISGASKGFGYSVGSKVDENSHAWNAITCGASDGSYRYIDSTWGAGSMNTDFM